MCTPMHIMITKGHKRALDPLVLEVRQLKVTQCVLGTKFCKSSMCS